MATAERAEALPAPLPALPYASGAVRIVAGILDLIVVASLFMLFVAVAGLLVLLRTNWGADSNVTNNDVIPSAIVLLSFFLFLPWYFTALWWWKGQSIGQMAVHIAVTGSHAEHLSFRQSLLRTVVWPLSLLPLGLGLAPMFFDSESRALHDMLAKTVVVEVA